MADRTNSGMAKRDVAYWDSQLGSYEHEFRSWQKTVKNIVGRYSLSNRMNEGLTARNRKEFNILWSNVQVTKPYIYSRDALPEVSRRHKDKDPVGRIGAEILQRAMGTELDIQRVADPFNGVALDLLLGGRGVPWVTYDADIREMPAEDENGEPREDDNGEPEMEERFFGEASTIEYVYHNDFAHAVRRNWADIEKNGWVAKRVAMDRSELVDEFGEVGHDVPLNASRGHYKDDNERKATGGESEADSMDVAHVWEVWDAQTRKVYWVCRDFKDKLLKESDDFLHLQNFFPCPKPAYGSITNRSLIPTPDYEQYRSMAAQLDLLVERESVLTEAVKVRGVFDKSMEGIARMLDDKTEGNKLYGIDNMVDYLAKGATSTQLNAVVQYLPLNVIVAALQTVTELVREQKQMIYEVSGIADIMRGHVDPREKLGQSRIKQQSAGKRIDSRRMEMERVVRDTYRIKAEIMVEHYAPDTLRELSGYDQMPEVMRAAKAERENPELAGMVEGMFANATALLKDDRMRNFRLDIETDATLMPDKEAESESRDRFLDSVGALISNAVPLTVEMPELKPVIGEVLKYSVRGHNAGRSLESAFDEFAENMQQSAQQAPPQAEGQQPEPPDPEKQAKAQAVQQKGQLDMQTGMSKLREQQTKEQAARMKAQTEAEKAQLENQKLMLEIAEKDAKIAELEERTRQTRNKGILDRLRTFGGMQGDGES